MLSVHAIDNLFLLFKGELSVVVAFQEVDSSVVF